MPADDWVVPQESKAPAQATPSGGGADDWVVPGGGAPSSTQPPATFLGKVAHAGAEALSQAGFSPPTHIMTAQEYQPAQGGFLPKALHAAKEAGAEVLPMMGLVMGPGVAPTMTAGVLPPHPSASGISPERAALAKEAKDVFGIPITAPQVGMSGVGKLAESASRSLPFSGSRVFEMQQRQTFNRAVSKTFGEDSPTITQQVMDRAKRRIGSVMDWIEKTNDVNISGGTIGRLATIEHDAQQNITPEEFRIVQRQIDNVLSKINANGQIPGEVYGALLRKNGPLDQAMGNQNSNISRRAKMIADTLRDALQNSLTGQDLSAYREARSQYKNMKTIEPLVNKSPTGDLSPALLNERVTKQFPDRAYSTSNIPLDRLAKIGQAFLKEPPTSGTSERGATFAEMAKIGGYIAAGDILGGVNAAAAVGGTLAANRVLAAYLRSQGLSDRMIARALQAAAPMISHLPASRQALRVLPGTVFGQNDKSDVPRRSPTYDNMVGNLP